MQRKSMIATKLPAGGYDSLSALRAGARPRVPSQPLHSTPWTMDAHRKPAGYAVGGGRLSDARPGHQRREWANHWTRAHKQQAPAVGAVIPPVVAPVQTVTSAPVGAVVSSSAAPPKAQSSGWVVVAVVAIGFFLLRGR